MLEPKKVLTCPHCDDIAPHGDERLVWLRAHLESRPHRWWWGLRKHAVVYTYVRTTCPPLKQTWIMGVEAWWWDGYRHYRDKVGLGRFAAVYRTLYWEVRGKEPKKYRSQLSE